MNDVFARVGSTRGNSTDRREEMALAAARTGEPAECLDVEPLSVPYLSVRRRMRILCAGPDLKSVRRALKRSAYDVTVAVAGKQAWRSLMTGFFDLMAASLALPGLDGIRLTER